MGIEADITKLENERLLNLMSIYLNDAPDSVTAEDIENLREFDIPAEEAFAFTLAGLLDLDIVDNQADRRFYDRYFPHMFHRFEPDQFSANPYLANIDFPSEHIGDAVFATQVYAPYEGFVCDDFSVMEDGRIVPHIGFFESEYAYPTVMENGRIWMSVTPQEILTIAPAVERAHGKVLTYGLGLGYFAYMAALKSEVESVAVVDCNADIASLFEQHLLPQFGYAAGKVRVIQDDAFEFAENQMAAGSYDFVYGDIWHDVGDGLDLYLRMKEYEHKLPDAEFMYWIEPTMKCYM